MKRTWILMVFLASAAPAQAGCFADYKAKQDAPLRLHYGVAKVDSAACDRAAAQQQLRARLSDAGWTLLNVLGTFDETGLEERKDNAGQFYLRY